MNISIAMQLGIIPVVASTSQHRRIEGEMQCAVLALLERDRGHHTAEMAKRLGTDTENIYKALTKLKEKGVAKRVGIIRWGTTKVSVWVRA